MLIKRPIAYIGNTARRIYGERIVCIDKNYLKVTVIKLARDGS